MNSRSTNNPNYVFDGTENSFQQLVIDNSYKGLVLVNYWTAKTGPCLMLWQVLEPLVNSYQGRFLLVNINSDNQKALARNNGITSVPTIKIYSKGEVVEAIHGAQSEASIRASIDRYLPPAKSSALAKGIAAYQSEHIENALKILSDAFSSTPDDLSLLTTFLKILFRQKRYVDMEDYVDQRAEALKDNEEISTILTHARLMHLAERAPGTDKLDSAIAKETDNIDCRLSRSAVAMVQNEFDLALVMLLSALNIDHHYHDGFARKAMLVIFSILGAEHELTQEYRKKMRDALER